jgi:hypothetical protein
MTDLLSGLKRPLALLAACAALFLTPTLHAQTALTAQEVMDKVYNAPRPQGTVFTMTMVITKNNLSLSRTLTTWAKGDIAKGESEKALMKFLAPADVKGSGFLNIIKPDGSTESLLWLPALGRVRRLGSGSSDQDMPFFGSDFTNRDINGFNYKDFTYELTAFAGGLYTITAAPKKSGGYDKLVFQVDPASWKYVKTEYWRAGKLVKSQTATYEKVQGFFMPAKIIMSSTSGSSTELRFSDFKLDQEIGEQFFTERFLKQ